MSQFTGSGAIDAPAGSARAVTPSDSANLPAGDCRALYVGTAGNIALILDDDTDGVTFTNVPVGIHPFRVRRVLATGTTASGIVALY